MGFPGGSDSKESACNAGDLGWIPGLGRFPGERNGNPLQYSCLENPHRPRSLAGYSDEVAKSPKWLSDQTQHTLAWMFVLNVLLGLQVPISSLFSLGNLITSLVAQMVKCVPTMQETRVQSLGQGEPLEKEMAAYSSILAWKIPWIEEPGRLQSMRSQRVRHDWVTSLQLPCSTSQIIIFNLFKDVNDDRGCWSLSSLRLAPRYQGRKWGNKPGSHVWVWKGETWTWWR